MTEEQLDKIRFRFGGDWYDTWWCSAFSWFALHEGGKGNWWCEEYHKEFFKDINSGWLDMYYVPPTEEEHKQAWIKSITINSNPYYNEKYYGYET
jgi:hypothetical protein